MGNEQAFLQAGPSYGNVTDAAFGRVGSFAGMDGVVCEVPRALAQRGTIVLTNSHNSFARDEATLHIPVRALENEVFIATNKVGPLLPADQVSSFAQALAIGEDVFEGAGESRIVGPDGAVIAIGPSAGEAVVVDDIDLADVERLRREQPQVKRRPACCRPLSSGTELQPTDDATETLTVAAVGDPVDLEAAVDTGAELVVLPECSEVPSGIPAAVTVVSSRIDGGAHAAVANVRSAREARPSATPPPERRTVMTCQSSTVLPRSTCQQTRCGTRTGRRLHSRQP